jgi:hypothetical protein
MVNLLERIRNIILGWLFKIFKIKNDIAKTRLGICSMCEHRINSCLGDICGQCGCVLDAKTRIIDERCDLDKW